MPPQMVSYRAANMIYRPYGLTTISLPCISCSFREEGARPERPPPRFTPSHPRRLRHATRQLARKVIPLVNTRS